MIFKFIGIRSKLGKAGIANAIASFDKTVKKLEANIAHCEADARKHQISISESEAQIRELGIHTERGKRVAAKLRELIA